MTVWSDVDQSQRLQRRPTGALQTLYPSQQQKLNLTDYSGWKAGPRALGKDLTSQQQDNLTSEVVIFQKQHPKSKSQNSSIQTHSLDRGD